METDGDKWRMETDGDGWRRMDDDDGRMDGWTMRMRMMMLLSAAILRNSTTTRNSFESELTSARNDNIANALAHDLVKSSQFTDCHRLSHHPKAPAQWPVCSTGKYCSP